MRVDFSTGDVFAVARPHPRKAAAPLVAAPLDPASSRINGLVVTPLDASGGYDDRVYVGSSYFDGFIDVKHNGYLTGIGQCSGTLFAANTVVTASHCVIGTSGAAASVSFSPRRRSSSSTPFGTGTSSWAEWETAYTSHNCHVSYSWSPCVYHDFMIVGFSGGSFSPDPGYAGFAWYGDSDITSGYDRTTGYPDCGQSGIVGCVTSGPYRDYYCGNTHPSLSGGSTSNAWPYSDGANPIFRNGCDFTPGQSGSSVREQASTAYILSLMIFIDCSDAGCVHSADGPRINSTVFNWMNSYR